MLKIMYFRITLLFTLISPFVWACDCSWKTIQDSYKLSNIVFYGKHTGTKKSLEVFDYTGNQIMFENFEIIRFYKGLKNENLKEKYTISLKSTAGESCGFKFDSNHYYLVYAHAWNAGNFWEVHQCSRTKEIRNGQFIVPTQPDPEAGKDEQRELMRLAQADSAAADLVVWQKDLTQLKLLHEESQLNLQKQLKKKNSMSIILSTTTLILLIYLLLDFWKKKTKA
jgi:hypothetical protein